MSETRWAARSAGSSARKLRWWAGGAAAGLLMLGIGATGYVAADVASASPDHPALDQSGVVAVSSANLDQYLATLEARATARRFLLTFGDLLFSADSA